MKALITILLLASSAAYAGTAFYIGEQISGTNKICFYSHLGSTITINVKSYQLCPLTIQV